MAKGIDYTVMEAKPSQLTRPQSTIASKHHSIKACISRSAGCKPQVAAGCWRLKADRSIKAPKHQSILSDLTARPCMEDGERKRFHGNGSKANPANAAPKHHSIKAPQHQSMYLAIRRLQTAGRCWLLAAEGRPQHQSPKAPKPQSPTASCQILRARPCMEDGERNRFHGHGGKADPS